MASYPTTPPSEPSESPFSDILVSITLPKVTTLTPAILSAAPIVAGFLASLVVLYLLYINAVLSLAPPEATGLTPRRWTKEVVKETYDRVSQNPPNLMSELPENLNRRYVVTGGSGLVGSQLIQQLLHRGTPASHVRIIDFRAPRPPSDPTLVHPSTFDVDFARTDISSRDAVAAAFARPWPASADGLPLTVFHMASVIIAVERLPEGPAWDLCRRVNVEGTRFMLEEGRAAGADVFIYTSSGSIGVRPVGVWAMPSIRLAWALTRRFFARLFGLDPDRVPLPTGPGRGWPRHFFQMLSTRDFVPESANAPQRPFGDYYGVYPASKAAAERLVCAANSPSFRTGAIRPVNGVYGDPTDNMVGFPMREGKMATFAPHVVQPWVHAANVAIAHLQLEAVLAPTPTDPSSAPHSPGSTASSFSSTSSLSSDHSSADLLPPQSGRPFAVSDPNPPIKWNDMYMVLSTCSRTGFRPIVMPPLVILLFAYIIELYDSRFLPFLDRHSHHFLPKSFRKWFPRVSGDVRQLKPALFSICTHLAVDDSDARRSVREGGIGYKGLVTSLEGICLEVAEWNRELEEKEREGSLAETREYTKSVDLADQIHALAKVGEGIRA